MQYTYSAIYLFLETKWGATIDIYSYYKSSFTHKCYNKNETISKHDNWQLNYPFIVNEKNMSEATTRKQWLGK